MPFKPGHKGKLDFGEQDSSLKLVVWIGFC